MNRKNNSAKMNHAIEQLTAEGIHFDQPTRFQIKVGLINFDPDRGTIYVDGESKGRRERGFETFLELLKDGPHFELPRDQQIERSRMCHGDA